MKWKTKLFLVGIAITLIGFSFYPVFEDPYHDKDDRVCFWEWLGKEIMEQIHGEKEKEVCNGK